MGLIYLERVGDMAKQWEEEPDDDRDWRESPYDRDDEFDQEFDDEFDNELGENPTDPKSVSGSHSENDLDFDTCPHCREEIYEGAEQCPYCGQYITDAERTFQSRTWVYWLGIALALTISILWGFQGCR